MFFRTSNESAVVDAARKELGYRAQVNRASTFGRLARYDGQTWNGAFVEHCLREAGMRETSVVSTVSAFSFYLTRNRLYRTPKVGDIVFMNFATNPLYPFEQPHVGIVTDISKWKSTGTVRTIEAETSAGLPRASTEHDGVFERTRSTPEIIAFARPRPFTAPEPSEPSEDLPKLRVSYFTSNPTTRKRAVTTLQTALHAENPDLSFDRGVWDGYTQSALDNFRRRNGLLGKSGLPDETDLALLDRATASKTFRFERAVK